jgi:hypothetical protein
MRHSGGEIGGRGVHGASPLEGIVPSSAGIGRRQLGRLWGLGESKASTIIAAKTLIFYPTNKVAPMRKVRLDAIDIRIRGAIHQHGQINWQIW